MPDNNDEQRFRQLLPFYLTKKLDSTEHRFIADYLHRHPEAMAEEKMTRRAYNYVRNLGATRNMDQRSAVFIKQFQRPAYLSRWQRLLNILNRHKDSFVFWLGTAAAAPVLLIDDLDMFLSRFGSLFVELMENLDPLPLLERFLYPAISESLLQAANMII